MLRSVGLSECGASIHGLPEFLERELGRVAHPGLRVLQEGAKDFHGAPVSPGAQCPCCRVPNLRSRVAKARRQLVVSCEKRRQERMALPLAAQGLRTTGHGWHWPPAAQTLSATRALRALPSEAVGCRRRVAGRICSWSKTFLGLSSCRSRPSLHHAPDLPCFDQGRSRCLSTTKRRRLHDGFAWFCRPYCRRTVRWSVDLIQPT